MHAASYNVDEETVSIKSTHQVTIEKQVSPFKSQTLKIEP
jgi:hypothetical protein